jgi:hypothetical protein
MPFVQSKKPVAKLSVAGQQISASPPSPYTGLSNQIGSPTINKIAQTAAMAKAAAVAPKQPSAPRPPIRRIQVRRPKFAKVSPFTLPRAPQAY